MNPRVVGLCLFLLVACGTVAYSQAGQAGATRPPQTILLEHAGLSVTLVEPTAGTWTARANDTRDFVGYEFEGRRLFTIAFRRSLERCSAFRSAGAGTSNLTEWIQSAVLARSKDGRTGWLSWLDQGQEMACLDLSDGGSLFGVISFPAAFKNVISQDIGELLAATERAASAGSGAKQQIPPDCRELEADCATPAGLLRHCGPGGRTDRPAGRTLCEDPAS